MAMLAKGATVDNGWGSLKSLNQVRLNGIFSIVAIALLHSVDSPEQDSCRSQNLR